MLRKLSRAQLRPFALSELQKQNYLCPLCGKPIDIQVNGAKSDYVVDHDHESGEVRGILHRSCNSGEGRVANGIGRWIAKSMSYSEIIPHLRLLLAYLERPGLGAIYPGHKTADERALITKQKRNQAAALRKAKLKVKQGA